MWCLRQVIHTVQPSLATSSFSSRSQAVCVLCGRMHSQVCVLNRFSRISHKFVFAFRFTIRPDLNDHIRKCHTGVICDLIKCSYDWRFNIQWFIRNGHIIAWSAIRDSWLGLFSTNIDWFIEVNGATDVWSAQSAFIELMHWKTISESTVAKNRSGADIAWVLDNFVSFYK